MQQSIRARHRSLVTFGIRLLFLFMILMFLWSRIEGAFIALVVTFGNFVLGVCGISDTTDLRLIEVGGKEWIGVFSQMYEHKSSHLFGFQLTALKTHIPLFLSLVFALRPLTSRHVKAAAAGSMVLLLMAVGYVLMVLTWTYTSVPEYTRYAPGTLPPFVGSTLDALYYPFNLLIVHIIPIVLWIATCFSISDLADLMWPRRTDRDHRGPVRVQV